MGWEGAYPWYKGRAAPYPIRRKDGHHREPGDADRRSGARTTRSVRSGLDLSRPVERELIDECVSLALQAPSGSNMQNAHFVVVTDPDTRRTLGEVYRRGWRTYTESPLFYGKLACVAFGEGVGRVYARPGVARDAPLPTIIQAAIWGSGVPAVTYFRLAARARGLGSCMTVVHLFYEKDAADVLGIPYDTVMQAALIPVAHAEAEELHIAQRPPLQDVLHWDAW